MYNSRGPFILSVEINNDDFEGKRENDQGRSVLMNEPLDGNRARGLEKGKK